MVVWLLFTVFYFCFSTCIHRNDETMVNHGLLRHAQHCCCRRHRRPYMPGFCGPRDWKLFSSQTRATNYRSANERVPLILMHTTDDVTTGPLRALVAQGKKKTQSGLLSPHHAARIWYIAPKCMFKTAQDFNYYKESEASSHHT